MLNNQFQKYNILFFGDSVLKELIPHFENMLHLYKIQNIQVVDGSHIGATSSEGVNLLNNFSLKDVNCVVVNFGLNDIRSQQSLMQYRDNLHQIARRLKTSNVRIIFCSITPFSKGSEHQITSLPTYLEVIRKITTDLDMEFFDMHGIIIKNFSKPIKSLRDGLHQTRPAKRKCAEELIQTVLNEQLINLNFAKDFEYWVLLLLNYFRDIFEDFLNTTKVLRPVSNLAMNVYKYLTRF